MNLKNLSTFVTKKSEKEKKNNFTHMPNKDSVDVNTYLFGSQSKTDLKKSISKKTKSKKSPFQNVKVDNKDFEIIKIIGRG